MSLLRAVNSITSLINAVYRLLISSWPNQRLITARRIIAFVYLDVLCVHCYALWHTCTLHHWDL